MWLHGLLQPHGSVPEMSLHPPGFIEPCLPTVSRIVPTGLGWAESVTACPPRPSCRQDKGATSIIPNFNPGFGRGIFVGHAISQAVSHVRLELATLPSARAEVHPRTRKGTAPCL